MWAELLPKMVGGIITDHDAPDEPTKIVGFELTDDLVKIKGEAFDFWSDRRYIGINAGPKPRSFYVRTVFGMCATVELP